MILKKYSARVGGNTNLLARGTTGYAIGLSNVFFVRSTTILSRTTEVFILTLVQLTNLMYG